METLTHQRLTQKQKDANDKAWYKEQIKGLGGRGFSSTLLGYGEVSEYKRKKVNYDLYNNILDLRDFEYVCKPYGAEVGELPATMTNRDIVSGKIKVLLGMEIKRPFGWKVIATNSEATTRKEQEKFGRIKDFVVSNIMTPIKQQIELKYQQQSKGKQLTEEQQSQIQQQIAQEMQAATPDEVSRYMKREHQDPAEIMAHQILEYLTEKQDLRQKFNKGWKHALIGGEEIYWVGIVNDEPVLRVVNSLYFDYDRTSDNEYIEDGEWAVQEIRMTPSDIVSQFGDELSVTEIDEIYEMYPFGGAASMEDFTFSDTGTHDNSTVRVLHCEWKSLCKIGFLEYIDASGQLAEMVVSEEYKINEEAGDISVNWQWIPERHEGYLIGNETFVSMRPVPGQYRDLDNMYECKLSYKGAAYDNMNSQVTSVMDRVKGYQYLFDIIIFRMELLMASDKGKKLIMDINMIPKSAGMDTDKWLYFFEANNIGFLNRTEEGNKGASDVTNSVKEIDMSLGSQLNQYIELAEYIERRCGESIGVPKQMEGQIGPNDAVTNTKQVVMQSSHILEPYFELHNNVKRNVLQSLIETAKIAYSSAKGNKKKYLAYVLDDLSNALLSIDTELLDESTYGLFVSNSGKAAEAKQLVESLAHAAIQTQAIDFASVFKITRSDSATEAEELMEQAEDKKQAQLQASEQQKQAAQKQLEDAQRSHEKEKWAHEKDMLITKEDMTKDRELTKQAEASMGFDTNKDENSNNVPDVLEVAKHGLDTNIKMRHQTLEEKKFEEQKRQNEADNKLKAKEIASKNKGNNQ